MIFKSSRYIIWVILTIVFAGSLYGQQRNPFDIIKTDSPQAIVSPSLEVPIARDSVLSNQVELSDSTPIAVGQASILDTAPISNTRQVDQDNPFNIIKTEGKALTPKPEEQSTEKLKEKTKSPGKATSLTTNNSWIPKLTPRAENNTASNSFSLNFIFWIMVTSLLVLAMVINLKRKSFLNLYRAITNDNYLKLLQREENNGFTFFFFLLYLIFLLNAALYIYLLLINKFQVDGYKLYLIIIAAIFGIYLVRYIGLFLLQITFPLEREAKQFSFTISMFNIIVGLLLVPINILIAYAPFGSSMVYIGIGIIAFFYLLRQLRGLFIASRTTGLRYFHFFIYLCTFEVAPVFWILSYLSY